MSDFLEEFYFALCSRCLCQGNISTESEVYKTVNIIKTAAADEKDEKSKLLSLSIVRLACELLKISKSCILIFKFCERTASELCPVLLHCVDCANPFVNYLSRKTLGLLIQHFPDTCSFCVSELCDGVNTGSSLRLLAIVDVLRIKSDNDTSELSLAGQEMSVNCLAQINPDLISSRRKILCTQKAHWVAEIESKAIAWFQKFNFSYMPILDLWCQLAITSLDLQTDEVICSLTKYEFAHILQNLPSSQKSTRIFISTIKSLLTTTSIRVELRENISKQFLTCLNNDLFDSICKRCMLKQKTTESTESSYDHVVVRSIISCALFSLTNRDDVELKDIFTNLIILLKKCRCDSDQPTYEELIISLFLDQDDELVNVILCHVDLHLKHKSRTEMYFNPFKLFREFLRAIDFDHNILLDMLMSNETRMLLLLVRFLKLAVSDWSCFVDAHSAINENHQSKTHNNLELDNSMSVFVKLNLSIERFEDKGIFPYKVTPLLRLLSQLEECYEA